MEDVTGFVVVLEELVGFVVVTEEDELVGFVVLLGDVDVGIEAPPQALTK